jgi:hypothetical protein
MPGRGSAYAVAKSNKASRSGSATASSAVQAPEASASAGASRPVKSRCRPPSRSSTSRTTTGRRIRWQRYRRSPNSSERTYTLTPDGDGTRFVMREEYTGPLAGMIFKSVPDLGPSFQKFADGLKQRAE